MEEFKPVLAKGGQLKQKVKQLEKSMADLNTKMKEQETKMKDQEVKIKEQEAKIKALEECSACLKIKELNDTINELRGKVDSITKLADCGDPGVPVHGSKTGNNYKAGGKVTLVCDTGYHLEGPTTLLCLENGNWDNILPKCHILCDERASLENGSWRGSEFWEGKNVTYQCNEGYKLQGPSVKVCNETGEWTGEEPTCEPEAPSAATGLEDSEILNGDDGYLKVLGKFLEPVVQSNSQWKLCWRASVDGWAGTAFHTNCDDKGPTVTIIRVGKYIFGGYTGTSWTGSSSCRSQYDSAAFLFTLVNKPGWQPLKLDQTGKYSYLKLHSIYSCSNYGPTFGGGHDIYIADYASSNTNSYSDLGGNYAPPTGYSYRSSFAQSFLAGSYNFQPDEVEVFYETT
ncbi:hypothetical protein ACROYT_G032302 [Oculina patagonica]